MKYRHLGFLVILLLAVSLVSCGGGSQPGSPSSSGDTGVVLEVAAVTPTYNSEDTYSVDVIQQICQPGPPPDYEYFADHSTKFTINARLENPDVAVQPGNLYIEYYTIQYRRSSDSVGAPPIEDFKEFRTILIPVPTIGSNGSARVEFTAVLVDLTRKAKYLVDVTGGQFASGLAVINNYTAIYTFHGKNEHGDSFSFTAEVGFQIGSFDYC